MCHNLLSDDSLLTKLDQGNFDLALIDNVVISDCFTVLAYKLGIPYIQIGAAYNPGRARIPFMPSVHSAFNLLGFLDEMSFHQRIANTLFSVWTIFSPQPFFDDDLVKTYVPEKQLVSLDVLHRRTSYHLIDLEHVLDFPKPSMPNMAFVGGLGTRKPTDLPSNLNVYMNSAKNGVIVVSFGGIANRLPQARMGKLIGILKKTKNVTFVLKYGNETKLDENILLMPWLPQNDLLAHVNCKAFITHCGNTGLYEALYHGVPMIGLPFMSDGLYNCRKMASKGFGISYDFCSFTESDLSNAIKGILNDSKYKDNIRKASKIFHSQQDTPSGRAAFWIDHVIQHGGEYLQTPATEISVIEYYLIDVLLCIMLAQAVIILCCVCVVKPCLKFCCRTKSKVD
ncbi:UDP-glucuronosyltransferase 2B31-like [Argopecten irradians]|uniref:UDP-glucuronosyltransferase 2B31-like n=1 Tax=Argopecten irradians TaxID=31199 RepID=UPI00371DE948